MRYFGALHKKWGETDALFAAACISSVFLLFIVIEPLITPLFQPKKTGEGSVIRTQLRAADSDSDNKTESQDPNKKIPTNSDSERTEPLPPPKQDSLKTETPPRSSESASGMPPTANTPEPNTYAFGAAPNIANPQSSPLIGAGGGFHSRPSTPPGPRKTTDTASDQALESYRNQIGQEAERRQAQAELAELMSSLESNEQYQCTIRSNNKAAQKNKNTESIPIARCTPNTPKSEFLEWILKRLYAGEICVNVSASQSQGFQKRVCAN